MTPRSAALAERNKSVSAALSVPPRSRARTRFRLPALGASIAWEEDFPSEIAAVYRNVILRDVEGNEFCLSGGSLPPGDIAAE